MEDRLREPRTGTEEITTLLRNLTDEAVESRDALFRCVYTELHRRANALMLRQPDQHTLQPTALVNELYLRLFDGSNRSWQGRVHFLRVASQAMRHILVDHARRKASEKRGGGRSNRPLEEVAIVYEDRSLDLLGLQEALKRLEELDPDMARAVDLRFFGGVTVEDTAKMLDIPLRTFTRRWQMTRAWLYREVQ